ncbi:MAG: hypothetical protein ABW019_02430 [Chitinophagaceae bacterium]
MNTYCENLCAATLATLQSQQLEQKNLQSQLNAAAFSLYYAQGAAITAAQRLQAASQDSALKAAVNNQAAGNMNSSVNQLSTAQQAAQYQAQATTNASVAAANVQVAANAIARLAGDAGSICTIINAADYDTDIYKLASRVRTLVNDTAYQAEVASQLAMEVSMLTAGISAQGVCDKSKAVSAALSSLRDSSSASLINGRQELAECDTALAAASAGAKTAEGVWKNTNVSLSAAAEAYHTTNRELNLDLAASPDQGGFTVRFRLITSPFPDQIAGPFPFPVSAYSIIVVKESKASVFTLMNADSILFKNPACCTQIILPGDAQTAASQLFTNDVPAAVSSGMASARFDVFRMTGKDGNTCVLPDSDGEALLPGIRYVAFLFATYQNSWKKALNVYDDFLSAPSQPFCMTNQLVAVDPAGIGIIASGEAQPACGAARPDLQTGKAPYTLYFSAKTQGYPVEYRCMFLPQSTGIPDDLFTADETRSLLDEIGMLEDVAEKSDPQIASLQSRLAGIVMEQQSVPPGSAEAGELAAEHEKVIAQLLSLQQAKDAAIKQAGIEFKKEPGFFFNAAIAGQVSAGNYSVAVRDDGPASGNETRWKVTIGPGTTDNFGNPLINGKAYIPAILSVPADEQERSGQYTSALSAVDATLPFTYHQ